MKSFNLEVGNIHIWIGTNNKIIVSCETTKKLMAFDTFDNAINGLFLSGKREAARALNSAVNNLKEGG